ncbi:hypothetical protein [Clostridium sardiniense]|nr:hypothetical protein [Clostridium sardiniense]MBM7834672.1 hypothetical protein [Clostridium sardiniense]
MNTMIFSLIPLIIMIIVWGVGIYALILFIKALKIYIKKNQ